MEKYFECFCCKELIGTVYESKCCGKLYCQNCKASLSNSDCTICSKKLDLQRNIFAQRMLKNIKVKCKYNCGKILPYDEMKQHLFTCDKKTYVCSFDKDFIDKDAPPFKGNKKEILSHLVKEHAPLLLIFIENYQNFEKEINEIIKNNTGKKKNLNNANNEDTILDLTSSGNIYLDFLRNSASDENTSIEFDRDIQLLNGINDLNLINSNLQNLNDLPMNNHHNRGNSGSYIGTENENEGGNEEEIGNDLNLLEEDLPRNDYQPLREHRYNSIFNENGNLSLEYGFNLNNNSGIHRNNIVNHLNNTNTRNRRRTGIAMHNNNQSNNSNNNINNINSNINNNLNNNENNINNNINEINIDNDFNNISN